MIFTKSKKFCTNKKEGRNKSQLKLKNSIVLKHKNSSKQIKCKIHLIANKTEPKIIHESPLKRIATNCTAISPKVIFPQKHVAKQISIQKTASTSSLPLTNILYNSVIPHQNVTKQKISIQKSTKTLSLPFTTILYNSVNINQVLVLLKQPIYIFGTIKLTLIAGSIDVFGYTPELNKQITIYSPGGFGNLNIKTIKRSPISKEDIKNVLKSLEGYYRKSQIAELIERFDISTDAVFVLECNRRHKIVNTIKKYMSENLFPTMNAISIDRPFYTSEFLLRALITTDSTSGLHINPLWQNIQINTNSKIMVIGGKNVGKSTLIRYLINKNIRTFSKMLLIDLDIGQSEVFVPQTISATVIDKPLLGPGFFFNCFPIKSFMVGKTNIVLVPYHYSEAIQKLSEYCRNNKELSDIPWIINTMGYNKGFGSEVIAMISSNFNPTDIVQIQSNKDANNFELEMEKNNMKIISQNIYTINDSYIPNHKLHILNSSQEQENCNAKEWQLSSKDVRHAIIIIRLSSALTKIEDWFTECRPISADLSKLKLISFDDNARNADDLVYALNANLVYMCKQETNEIPECFGIAIVRGIDFERNIVVLIPAVSETSIAQVNTLAIGDIPLPSAILTNQGPKIKNSKVPYVYSGLDEFGSKYIKQMLTRPQQSSA